MKPLHFGSLLVALLLSNVSQAGTYGSKTDITLVGSYHLTGASTAKTTSSGATKTTSVYLRKTTSQQNVLKLMQNQGLIPTTTGYSVVLVAQARMSDGIRFFAIKTGESPVEIPSDILSINVYDGPVQGTTTVDSESALKSISCETRNYAALVFGPFTGYGILVQKWTSATAGPEGAAEVVELVSTTGTFNGFITGDNSGVGTVNLTLANATPTKLTRYGMATEASDSSSYSGGTLVVGGGSTTTNTPILMPGGSPGIDYSGGTLTGGGLTITGNFNITGTTVNLANYTYAGTSTVTINTTTGGGATGLAVDSNGAVTQLPTFGSTLPGTLIIITASGTHTYTHDTDGIWTLSVP